MFSVPQKLTSLFTNIANAIRTMCNISISLQPKDFYNYLLCADDKLEQTLNQTLTTILEPDTINCSTVRAFTFQFCTSLAQINFPQCTTIGSSAFYQCTSLTQINFPQCSTIGTSAFASCTSLSQVSFPQCTTIGTSAFAYCTSLSQVSFPQCSTINNYAFYYCQNLISLYLLYSSICVLNGVGTFTSTPISRYYTAIGRYGSIFVPSSLVASYKNATNWTTYANRIFAIEYYPWQDPI